MFKIRPATENDASQIAAINVLGWKTTYRGLIPNEVLDNLSITEQRITNFKKSILECEIFLVAENNTRVIGYLNAGKPKTSNFPYPYEIYGFYIHPDYQRKGIGTALIRAFMEKIKPHNFCVCLISGNKIALNFYQKMGGKRFPELDVDGHAYHCNFREEFLGFTHE